MVANFDIHGKTQENSKKDIKYVISFLVGAEIINNVEVTDKEKNRYIAVEAILNEKCLEVKTAKEEFLIDYDNILKIKDIEKNTIIFEEIE